MKILEEIDELYSRDDIMSRPSPVPKRGGVYFWYFNQIPPEVTSNECKIRDGKTLLYVGISPSPPPRNGKPPSKQNLNTRIRYHLNGNAEGSTLRLSLGVLLSNILDIQLRRVGSGKRMTFHEGEKKLNDWLDRNAFIGWKEHENPWEVEEECIQNLSLPLNLEGNAHHPFQSILKALRKSAKARAKDLEIV